MSNGQTQSFSWIGYKSLVQSFLNAGYEPCHFDDVDPAKLQVILRHDVDFSLKAAVDIARIEADLGLSAHYYVLLRTEFYNLFSPLDWDHVHTLIELGHNVGLHFDASQYGQDLGSLEAAAARECHLLEMLLGRDVTSISFHRPAPALLGLARKLAGRRHAYEPAFFSNMAYVTDSRGEFRYGHPLDHAAFLECKSMQLVTHPIWWPEHEIVDKMALLDGFLRSRSELLTTEAGANCIPYAAHIAAKHD